VDHAKGEYARYPEDAPVIHTNTVEGYFSEHCKEKHLHRYLAEFDFRYNARVRLGVDDQQRAVHALKGAKGKRTTADRRRSEAGAEPEAPPF
jgi:hypothetical protein